MNRKKKEKGKSRSRVKPFRMKDVFSKFSFQYWREHVRRSKNKDTLYLILMKLRNGKFTMFTVVSSDNTFDYKGGHYHIDPDMAVEDTHSNLSTLFYHQDCASPFSISFNLDKLKKTLEKNESSDGSNIIKAINPRSLKNFIESKVIEKVLQGQELTDQISFLTKVMTVNVILTVGILLILAKSMGWI